ncbi:MAG: RsmE family RNA methyltransferase [Candidatus Omnitrophota bacterium]
MSRFYVPHKNIHTDHIIVDGQEARHILDVMRMNDGDTVVVFDGTGVEYSGFIKESNRKNKTLIIETVSVKKPLPDSLPGITLAQAIPKQNKMDYIVEKATELGVSVIIPLISKRTIVRPDDAGRGKKNRKMEKDRCSRGETMRQDGSAGNPGYLPV